MNSKIFSPYDIRGKYPEEINEGVVLEIANYLPKILQHKAKIIVIGHDVRLSSPSLYQTINKQLITNNRQLTIVLIGLSTTPMFSFLVNHFKADGGIMITASHNPKEYNGLKIVGKNAIPISGEEILKIINQKKEHGLY